MPLALWGAPRGPASRAVFVLRSLLGSFVFLYAGFALHFSAPTPIQIFTSGTTTEAVFRFPLALVATFLVPFFVGVHAATLWRLRAVPGAPPSKEG